MLADKGVLFLLAIGEFFEILFVRSVLGVFGAGVALFFEITDLPTLATNLGVLALGVFVRTFRFITIVSGEAAWPVLAPYFLFGFT